MRFSRSVAALVGSLAHTQAQHVINELSFGVGARISPEGQKVIPNFGLLGRPGTPELLSDRLILTPPTPGSQRGAVWSEKTVAHTDWVADIHFRANGPERGGGNLNIWLAKDGSQTINTNSLYTVGRFEGLALVIDQHGGAGGMIRGFLNDGTTDYQARQYDVDRLAFGHCSFSYRNLGRPSQIKVRHGDRLRVEVDDRLCFESDKIRIPTGYNIGVTAASADNPDSFELFKVAILSEEKAKDGGSQADAKQAKAQEAGQQQGQGMFDRRESEETKFQDDIPDMSADAITTSAAQFADLHDRLQAMSHYLARIYISMSKYTTNGEKRHEQVKMALKDLSGLMTKLDKWDSLEPRISGLEREMRTLRSDITARLRDSENSIKYHVSDKHEAVVNHVRTHAAPGHRRLILVIVGGQLFLLGGYVFYKKRKSTPKKYL